MDSLTHLDSKNVYFIIHHSNSSKITMLDTFHNLNVDTSLLSVNYSIGKFALFLHFSTS